MNGTKILTSAKFGGFVLPVKSVSIIALGVLILLQQSLRSQRMVVSVEMYKRKWGLHKV